MRSARRFKAGGWEPLEDRDMPSVTGAPGGPSPVQPVARTDPYAVARLARNLQQAARGEADVVFLGDSLTDNWTTVGAASWASQVAPLHAVDFGIVGNTTGNLLSQIAAGELAGRPKVVVLMIGTNNLVHGNNADQVEQGIAAVVAAVRSASPQSQILLMGLLPMDQGSRSPRSWEAAAVNSAIARLDDGAHVHFISTSNSYLLPGGALNRALYRDNVHLNASGYMVWGSAIRVPLTTLISHALPPSVPVTPPPAPPPTLSPTLAPKRHRGPGR